MQRYAPASAVRRRIRTFVAPPASSRTAGYPWLNRSGAIPLPQLGQRGSAAEFYCVLTPVDRGGRAADISPVRHAGWRPGETLRIQPDGVDLLVISKDPGEGFAISRQGHLVLPAAIRHHLGLRSKDRVFVAAHQQRSQLVLMTTTIVDDILTQLVVHRGLLEP